MRQIYFFKKNWSLKSSLVIYNLVEKICKKKKINFFLTGGKTSIKIYKNLSKKLKHLNFFLEFFITDERYVSIKSKYSNSKLILKKFILNSFNKNKFHSFFKNPKVTLSLQKRVKNYEKKISTIDVILLSLAEDGHIAGLFPGYYSEFDKKKYFWFKKKNENFFRISLTLKSILKAKYIFIMVNGKKRFKIFQLLNKKISTLIPAKVLYRKAIWLIKI